jgi:hypothetical protein
LHANSKPTTVTTRSNNREFDLAFRETFLHIIGKVIFGESKYTILPNTGYDEKL